MVRYARHPARPGLSRQPVSADHRRHDGAGRLQLLVLQHTLLGKKLQATSQDKEMASLLGISVSTMIMITFVYSAMLGGLPAFSSRPSCSCRSRWAAPSPLKAFAATIIGGFGDVAGAIIGGLALGIIETFGRPTCPCPTRTASPSWCSWHSSSSARRAFSANAWRRGMSAQIRTHGPAIRGHLAYAALAIVAVFLAATMKFDGYV